MIDLAALRAKTKELQPMRMDLKATFSLQTTAEILKVITAENLNPAA